MSFTLLLYLGRCKYAVHGEREREIDVWSHEKLGASMLLRGKLGYKI